MNLIELEFNEIYPMELFVYEDKYSLCKNQIYMKLDGDYSFCTPGQQICVNLCNGRLCSFKTHTLIKKIDITTHEFLPYINNNINDINDLMYEYWQACVAFTTSAEIMGKFLYENKIKDDLRYHPRDVISFFNCMSFFEYFPHLREKLSLLKPISHEWKVLVENWDYLESEIKKEMKEQNIRCATYKLKTDLNDYIHKLLKD